MRYLTRHFSLEELCRSQWALRMGFKNEPTEEVVHRLELVCTRILEPLRDHVESPVVVSSGYRNATVNAAHGGKPTSQHLLGEAADIHVPGRSNLGVCDTIVRLALPFDQLILEHGEAGWVHVSHGPRNRREVLRGSFSGGDVVYSPLNLEGG